MSTATKAVLLGLQDAAAFEVLVFLFDREVHHGIDHVLELVGASHLTGLVYLVDTYTNRTGLFAEVGDFLEAADGCT